MGRRLKLFFEQLFPSISSVFTEQSQICAKNAILAMIEQGDLLWQDNLTHCSCQVWRHTYLWPMTLHNQKKIYCKDIREELKNLSEQDRVIKICTDAGFLTTVEVGQYFMTKDTEEFSKFTDSVALVSTPCQEVKIYMNEKVGFEGTLRLDPVLEVTTSYLQGNFWVEIRIESVNKDNSHSWVRISHGLNKLVTNLNNKEQDDNEQETSEMQFEDYALKSNARAFASWSKAKAKPQRRTSCQLIHKTIPVGERTWTDIEPGKHSLSDYSVSKKLIFLLRHGSLPREDDGAIEFWRLKIIFGTILCNLNIGLTMCGRAKWQRRRRKQEKISILYWSFRRNSIPPSSSRSFRTQSRWSFITGQCINSGRFLRVHLSRWMCNQLTHHHEFRIDTGRTNFEQKTDSMLSACESHGQRTQRSWDSRPESTTSCTVHADSVEETSKHCVLGRHQSCSKERIKVLSDSIERHHSSWNTSSLLYSENC